MPAILLVDDEPAQRDIYRAILEHAGYSVLEASDGEATVRMAEAHHPDLILLDMGLPGQSGWEVAQRLKSGPSTAAIRVVGLSAHAMPEHKEAAKEAGCDGYLTKPIEPRAVLESVRERIGPATPDR